MTKKWIAINLLLLLTAGFLARQLRESILHFKVENDLAKIQPARELKQKMIQDAVMPLLAADKVYDPEEFAVIPERNVFAETRSSEDQSAAQAGPEIPPLAQKPILVGISISENQKLASVIDPLSAAQNQNRRAQTKRIGDVYQGYTITDIASDHIVLDSGQRKEIIPLHQGSKRAQGGKTAILATRVVSIGGSGAGSTSAVTVVSSGTSAVRTTPASPAAPAQPAAVSAGTARATASQVRPAPGSAQPSVSPAVQPSTPQPPIQAPSSVGAPGTRVIRSPFGDIIRPNP